MNNYKKFSIVTLFLTAVLLTGGSVYAYTAEPEVAGAGPYVMPTPTPSATPSITPTPSVSATPTPSPVYVSPVPVQSQGGIMEWLLGLGNMLWVIVALVAALIIGLVYSMMRRNRNQGSQPPPLQ